LRSALEAWKEVGAPYIVAKVRLLLGRACRDVGDDDAATIEFDLARKALTSLGATPDLAVTTDAPHALAPEDKAGLSRRELEVLRHLATGKTNKAIALLLHLSEKTVDRHVSNIFAKIDVSSRAAATAYAYQQHLV
jgi:DNA-binding NarL/FixJ family response regulator